MDTNPYLAPVSAAPPQMPSSTEEAVRMAHIKHESVIRTTALFYCVPGIAFAYLAVTSVIEVDSLMGIMVVAILLGMSVLIFSIFSGLRKFKTWARWTSLVLASLLLLVSLPMWFILPLTLLVFGATAYATLSPKATVIFRPDYQRIIAATPHIKNPGFMSVWLLIAILLIGSIVFYFVFV